MDDSEPTLPPHPENTCTYTRPSRPSILTRKRTHDQSLYDGELLTATSSDPALFSGDEQDSIGAEDYATKRKKKMYTGSWWSHRVKADKDDRKKELKRNFDSGIFMGSESEPPSSDSINSLEEELLRDQATSIASCDTGESLGMLGQDPPQNDQLPTSMEHGSPDGCRRASRRATRCGPIIRRYKVVMETSPSESEQRSAVLNYIRKCLEHGQETVDLSDQDLSDVPSEIRELACMTKQQPLVSGMLNSGASLEAHLRLYLSQNLIRQFPTPILDLTNLIELSLFRNKLTELPTGIRSLINLKKLNVCGNKLTSLPYEVIELVTNHKLHFVSATNNLWEDPTPEPRSHYFTKHLGRDMQPIPTSVTPEASTSLTEMVLRQLARLRPLESLDGYMPLGTSPRVLTLLQTLNDTLQEGGRHCNSCHRMIVQSKEWVEWWWITTDYVPVKRVRCDSDCQGTLTEWCEKPSV